MYGMSRLSVCLAALLLCCAGPSPAAGSSAPAGPALTGMVLSPAGQPLPGVRVELRPVLSGYTQSLLSLEDPEEPSAVAVATTDAAGRYALRAPETGIWRVTVRSPGMVTLHFPVLPLAGPRELPPAPLTADAGAPLLLTDQAGKPLAGAWIAASSSGQPAGGIFPADWRPAPQVGRTDGRGSLSLERRDGETLEVSVFLPGRAETVRSGFTGGSLQIPAGGETARDLRVVSRSGEPIPDTAVRIGPRAWPAGRWSQAWDGRGLADIRRLEERPLAREDAPHHLAVREAHADEPRLHVGLPRQAAPPLTIAPRTDQRSAVTPAITSRTRGRRPRTASSSQHPASRSWASGKVLASLP